MARMMFGDTETASEADLRSVGVYKYAEHPSTRIQLFSFTFDDDPEIRLWSPADGEEMPDELMDAFMDDDCTLLFHNAQFDRVVIEKTLGIVLPITRYRCMMAQALSHSLPGALDKLGAAFNISDDVRKIRDGHRLVLKFCKPRGKHQKWATPETDPEDWAKYKEYCIMDTRSMRELYKLLPKWNYPQTNELALWYLDQQMNDRGMQIDLDLVQGAVRAVDKEQAILAGQTKGMTNGVVDTASQRDAMLAHILEEFGIELPDMRKATLEKMLDDPEYPEALRDLIQVRLSTCTSSTAKYKKLIQATCQDGRLRGTIQYCGASRTGRDCIAGGSLVLVMGADGQISEKPIEFVELTDLVFDGGAWVKHDGVEFKGLQEVIEHDGVCATPDHIVFLKDGYGSCTLGTAKKIGLELWEV